MLSVGPGGWVARMPLDSSGFSGGTSGAGVAAAYLLCFQYLSYPQARRGLGIFKSIAFLFKFPFACLGFGGAVSLLFAIPLISSFGDNLTLWRDGNVVHPQFQQPNAA